MCWNCGRWGHHKSRCTKPKDSKRQNKYFDEWKKRTHQEKPSSRGKDRKEGDSRHASSRRASSDSRNRSRDDRKGDHPSVKRTARRSRSRSRDHDYKLSSTNLQHFAKSKMFQIT